MTRHVIPVLFAASLSFLAGCGEHRSPFSEPATTAPATRAVKVARAVETPIDRVVPVVGNLLPQDEAVLSMKVAGRVESILVDLGATVTKGQLLARIEPRDYELKLKQATALLAQARARMGLTLEGADDHADIEATSTVKQARAVLDEAQKNRDRVSALSKQGIISQSELETADAGYLIASNKYQDALVEIRDRQALLSQRRVEYD
ncbi:MAG TPA: biotin/lipoyl-binding protein, partial [Verrucomicrobiae bacterium]|nr:biotin/lipoyl-binding protein [Verrucomicrobiae bacterium]